MDTFTILIVEGFSEKELFRHLSNHVFGFCNFENTKALRVTFSPKRSKVRLDFKNSAKNKEKILDFWDNCIWIGMVKLSLLRTGYFSLAANVLRSCPKNWHADKSDFFQLNLFAIDQWTWLRSCDAHFNSAWARLACHFSKGTEKRDFLGIYLTTFSEFVISEIKKLRGSFFFSKRLNFNLDVKNKAKNLEIFVCL